MIPSGRRLEKQLIKAACQNRAVVPEAGRLLWSWFLALSATRSVGMVGPMAISFTEIEAYARLHKIPIEPKHVAMLRAMDRALLEKWRQEEPKATAGINRGSSVSKQEISPQIFDLLFS